MKLISKVLILGIVIGELFAGAALATYPTKYPSTPTSSGGVTPWIIPGQNSGGNRTCAEVGQAFFGNPDYYKYSSERIDGKKQYYSLPYGLQFSTNGTYVSFSSSFSIGAVIVKGGPAANVYVYEPQRLSDSGLAAPVNSSGNSAGLSNITFCWNKYYGSGGN
jgi:hypothetical protein